MCLIVHRPNAGAHLPNSVIEQNLKQNDDGFGIAWREGGELKWEKFGPKEADKFKKLLKRIDKSDMEYVAHFRMSTHGLDTAEFAHPYPYKDRRAGQVLVFHNGIIPSHGNKEVSDTHEYVNSKMRKLPSRWWRNEALTFFVEETIGSSRLLIMTDEEIVRLSGGYQKWVQEGGIFYSAYPAGYTKSSSGSGGSRAPQHYGSHGDSAWGPHGSYSSVPRSTALTDDEDGEGDKYWYNKHFGEGLAYRGPASPLKSSSPKDGAESGSDENGSAIKQIGFVRPQVATVKADSQWKHNGHDIEAVDTFEINSDGEAYGGAWCRQCDTEGEYYIIGGEAFIDIVHKVFAFEGDDDDEDYPRHGIDRCGVSHEVGFSCLEADERNSDTATWADMTPEERREALLPVFRYAGV